MADAATNEVVRVVGGSRKPEPSASIYVEVPPPESVDLAIPIAPFAHELDALASLVDAHGASLTASEQRDAKRCLALGAYTSALHAIDLAKERAPKNVSLRRLHDELGAACVQLLTYRLGSIHRHVLVNHDVRVHGESYQRLLRIARERPTILQLVRQTGADPLLTLEQLVRLVRSRAIILGPYESTRPKS